MDTVRGWLFAVTAVLAPVIRFVVVHVTDELQVEAPFGISQEVAAMVPDGSVAPEQVVPFQAVPVSQVAIALA